VEELEIGVKETDVILDAIFGLSTSSHSEAIADKEKGFSFHPPLRRPFDRILALIGTSSAPILSVDIPSGWDVEHGRQQLETEPDEHGKMDVVETFVPDTLVSLTAPKEGVKEFKGRHWLGGRFVPE
jgi:NAD(P)H-hydrate epimerase